ncbi:MAG: winged helix DNA-binding domain-containing protein [Luteitalea sp.]
MTPPGSLSRQTVRDLNRATLARQGLLARQPWTVVDAVGRLLGLQMQMPRPAFVALWSRLANFDRDALAAACRTAALVRATAMRSTLHLMRATDLLEYRATLVTSFEQGITAILGDRLAAASLDAALADARAFFATPHTFDALRVHLESRYPGQDIRALAYASRLRVPLLQEPDQSPWAYPAKATFVRADARLGAAFRLDPTPDALIVRYLAAYGPASVVDAQAWLGLGGLAPVFARLRPTLTVLAGPTRAELFDVPDGPRPGADVPAPVRLLPEWDSVLIARADERLLATRYRARVFRPGLRVLPTVLVDGQVAGTWAAARTRTAAALTLTMFESMSAAVRRAVIAEAEALIAFTDPDARTRTVAVAGG